MISLFSTINITSSGILNTVIQTLLFELTVFLGVPLIGIIIDAIIVRGLRASIAKLTGPKGDYIFSNYVLFIGVVIHELSHAFFALISGARVEKIVLFNPDGDTLGYVLFTPRGNKFLQAFQNSFTSCAPVVIGTIFCALMITKLAPVLGAFWQWLIAIYIFISILFHMNMSKPDLKIYFSGTLPLLLMFLPICLIIFALV